MRLPGFHRYGQTVTPSPLDLFSRAHKSRCIATVCLLVWVKEQQAHCSAGTESPIVYLSTAVDLVAPARLHRTANTYIGGPRTFTSRKQELSSPDKNAYPEWPGTDSLSPGCSPLCNQLCDTLTGLHQPPPLSEK